MRHVANHTFDKCPRCGAKLQATETWTSNESEFWLECSNPDCNTYVNTYIPQPYQANFHRDPHHIKANFGGYGSGKTTTSRMELEKTILITPAGATLIGANVTSQYEQTIKREFEADFPKAFYSAYSTQKSYADFINGHRVMYRPYDDPGKLRSYNLSMWLILEASEVKEEAYTQLKTRLRNSAATVPEVDEDGNVVYERTESGVEVPKIAYDWRTGIIESNPSAGWIKNSVLNYSDEIHTYGEVRDVYYQNPDEKDPLIATHITATSANAYLPKDFIAMQVKNHAKWWVDRYIYGSFRYSDGLVYPSAQQYFIEPYDIPRNWKRIVAFDYGLADASCFLFAAINEKDNQLVFYKEVYANNRSVEELAALYFEAAKDIPVGGMVCAPIIDPKSGPRRDYDKKTLADSFLDYNISFIPGAVNRDARVYRLNTYLESGRVRIMRSCAHLVEQLRDLKFKPEPTSTTKPWRDEPEDKNDHAVVCAEWIVMELPKDPNQLMYGAYNLAGERFMEPQYEYDPEEQRRRDDEEWMLQALDLKPATVADTNYFYNNYSADYRFGG